MPLGEIAMGLVLLAILSTPGPGPHVPASWHPSSLRVTPLLRESQAANRHAGASDAPRRRSDSETGLGWRQAIPSRSVNLNVKVNSESDGALLSEILRNRDAERSFPSSRFSDSEFFFKFVISQLEEGLLER
jgi:hypothetical protein